MINTHLYEVKGWGQGLGLGLGFGLGLVLLLGLIFQIFRKSHKKAAGKHAFFRGGMGKSWDILTLVENKN